MIVLAINPDPGICYLAATAALVSFVAKLNTGATKNPLCMRLGDRRVFFNTNVPNLS